MTVYFDAAGFDSAGFDTGPSSSGGHGGKATAQQIDDYLKRQIREDEAILLALEAEDGN